MSGGPQDAAGAAQGHQEAGRGGRIAGSGRLTPARAVLLLAAVLVIWNSWAYDLWAPDEPYFGEGAREMIADGQWVVPHVNGVVTTDKPPLFFWLIALLSLPLGAVSSFSARLPSILAFVGTIALTMRLARRWGDERAAAVAGLVLATMYLPWDKGRTAQIDMTLCFFILAALSAFEAARAAGPALDAARGRRLGWIFWGCIGLGLLSKGPVALLVPLGVALGVVLFDRRAAVLRRLAPVTGPLLMLAIPGAWILLETVAGPPDYSVVDAFRHHVLERGFEGMHHKQPFYYFVYTMPLGLLPWTFFVPGAAWFAWKRRKSEADQGPDGWPADRMLLVWFAFVVLFFSIWREKRDLYVLPAYPAVAILVSRLVAAVAGWRSSAKPEGAESVEAKPAGAWLLAPAGLAAVLFGLGALLLPGAVGRIVPAASEMSSPITALCVVLGAGAFVVLREAYARRPARSVLMLATATAALYLAIVTFVYPAANPLKSVSTLARRVALETRDYREAGGQVLAYKLGNTVRQVAFYSDGIYPLEVGPGEFVKRFTAPEPAWAVVDGAELEGLLDRLGPRVYEVARAGLSGSEVLLIVNEAP